MENESHAFESERQKGSFAGHHPYAFVFLLVALFLAVDFTLEATTSDLVLPYTILAIIAVAVITKKRWWRETGFTLSKARRRSLLLFVPASLPILWWILIAPLMGNGTVMIPGSLAAFVLLLGVALLIGFVEETYFRGMMLRALKSKGVWTAALVTAFLFGPVHLENALLGASLIPTALQVGYATAIGLAFSALVLTTGMIWPLVFIHAMIDFVPNLNTAALGATTVTQLDYITTMVLMLVYAPYGLILLWRMKHHASSSHDYAVGVARK